MKHLYLIAIFCLTIFSCKEEDDLDNERMSHIFDVPTFIEQEIETYKNSTCSIYKEGEVNGVTEQKSISMENFDWEKEFKIVSNMNLRKISWVDNIQTDTISDTENEEVFIVRYQTNSSKIPIKKLSISYLKSAPTVPILIEAERSINNWIFNSQQKIYYNCGTGLRAEGFQKVLWLKEKEFNITTIYNCKNESN